MKNPLPSLDVLDQFLGLRSWGLVLYGTLPACLSLLGLLEIKVKLVERPIPILLISLIPLAVTFLLVRARERDWYFTDEYLNVRSCVTTAMIIVCATAISGAAGIIRGVYKPSWTSLTDQSHMNALLESFLFGIASLVVSSTLFATVLTKGADLPGLPSTAFTGSLAKLRQQLLAIRRNSIWRMYPNDEDTTAFDELETETDKLIKELLVALSQPGQRLAKLGLTPLEADLKTFAQQIVIIKDGAGERKFRWEVRFADFKSIEGGIPDNLANERESLQNEYAVLQRIYSLRLGG